MKNKMAYLIYTLSLLTPYTVTAQDNTSGTWIVFQGCEHLESEEEKSHCFDQKFKEFISKNLRYPQEAINSAIQGTVYVRFTIDVNGDVKEITVTKGVHKSIDEEAIRLISLLPKFKPATLNGNNVSRVLNFPLNFTLK